MLDDEGKLIQFVNINYEFCLSFMVVDQNLKSLLTLEYKENRVGLPLNINFLSKFW